MLEISTFIKTVGYIKLNFARANRYLIIDLVSFFNKSNRKNRTSSNGKKRTHQFKENTTHFHKQVNIFSGSNQLRLHPYYVKTGGKPSTRISAGGTRRASHFLPIALYSLFQIFTLSSGLKRILTNNHSFQIFS